MASSADYKSFCEVLKYVINTRPKVDEIHEWIAEIDEFCHENILSIKITLFSNLEC